MSEVGRMVDFLKANPFVSMDDYLWKYSVPYLRLMAVDNTRVIYLSEEQAKKHNTTKYGGSHQQSFSDLGVPIFGNIVK